MKRSVFTVSMLLLAMLASSCGQASSSGGSEATSAGDAQNTETTTVEETTGYYDNVEGLNLRGYDFNILTYNSDKDGNWHLYLAADEQNGELLNDAAYTRNKEVEELLNVKISADYQKRDEYEKLFQNAVLAGDGDVYDLVTFWSAGTRSVYITENLVYDWKQVPYLELEADWYNQSANDTYTIAGKQYFGVSDITFAGQQNASILFNIGMVKNFGLASPYDAVRDGNWTIDTMHGYFKDIYADLNGDGVADENDRYGYLSHVNVFGRIMASSGNIEVIANDSGFELNLFDDRTVAVFEKIRALVADQNVWSTSNSALTYDTLANGTAMFIGYASDPAKLRDIDFDFGYLPFPKYDESQESYITEAAGGMMAIPHNASDIERTGAVVEALSAASSKYLADAFVETYIENKVLRDEGSVECYHLCRDTYVYNISYNIDPANLLSAHKFYSTMLKDETLEHASYYASVKDTIEASYKELFDIASSNG